MGFAIDPSMVRVDFFKPSGKWYTTEAVKWLTWHLPSEDIIPAKDMLKPNGVPTNDEGKNIYDAFVEALKAHLWDMDKQSYRLAEMDAVCLEPYHQGAFPLLLRGWANE